MEKKKPYTPPSRSQLLYNLIYSMVPLIGFWLVEKFWGLEAGLIVAIALGISEVLVVYIRERRFEPFSSCSAILVVGMGIISWQTGQGVFIRLKPAVMEGAFALAFIVSSLLKKPIMLLLARKQFGDIEFDDFQIQYFNGVNFRVGLLFLLHTLITIYAAVWMSTDAWIFVRGVLFYILFFIYFIGEFIYSRFFLRKKAEKIAMQHAFLEYQKDIIIQMRKQGKRQISRESEEIV